MPDRVTPTCELLARLKNAQLKHASQMAADAVTHGYSDDGYDYLRAALGLALELVNMDYDTDLESFDKLLNDTSEHGEGLFDNFACDGICPEIYDLNPPSLREDDD